MAEPSLAQKIVDTVYRATLRRAPDEGGLASYLQLVNNGASVIELLKMLMDSDEFRGHTLIPAGQHFDAKPVDAYQPENDVDIGRFMTPKVRAFAEAIRANPLDIVFFRQTAADCIKHIYSYNQEFGESQKGYFEYHERRFYEIDGVVGAIVRQHKGTNSSAVLDFGFSINSHILRQLFDDIRLEVADRPQISPPAGDFDGVFSVDLSLDNIAEISLGKKFDLIIFSEVIEHVMINPIKMLKFLLAQLSDSGYVIVTTPNLFSRHKLQLIAARKNPLETYPLEYGRAEAPHFHIREYCMSQMLSMIELAGGSIKACFFSDCWDPPNNAANIPEHELGNLFLVFGK